MSTSGSFTFISLSEYDSWGGDGSQFVQDLQFNNKIQIHLPFKSIPSHPQEHIYLSHLDTCSQQLLLLRTHQTQTAPSSVCGGDS